MKTLFSILFLISVAHADPSETLIKVGKGNLHVELPIKNVSASSKAELEWLQRAANAVSHYFGRFPVKDVAITVKQVGAGESINGTTWSGRKIELKIGSAVLDAKLATDWTATHEMFHLAFPEVYGHFEWMGEGLATYLEPIARERVGDLRADQVWSDMIDGFTRLQNAKADTGLDRNHSWASIYWGGALFWFAADVEIREKTKDKKSLDTAMRAILDAGGDASEEWTQEKIFQVGDKATGLHVLEELHLKLGVNQGSVNVDALWKRLGISKVKDKIAYDDRAPLSFIRKSIMKKALP